jgi:uncharacterized lipoprotein YajG
MELMVPLEQKALQVLQVQMESMGLLVQLEQQAQLAQMVAQLALPVLQVHLEYKD